MKSWPSSEFSFSMMTESLIRQADVEIECARTSAHEREDRRVTAVDILLVQPDKDVDEGKIYEKKRRERRLVSAAAGDVEGR